MNAPIHAEESAQACPHASPAHGDGGPLVWAIGPAFVLLGVWLVLASPRAGIPIELQPLVDRDRIAPGARRQPMGEPPSVVVGGFAHACNECHRLFDSPPVERRILVQHTDIVFSHGMNNRCFNCHDRTNRERLVLHDGTLVTFDDVPTLCSQCHGTVYRDWQTGTHGKTLGSWDAANPPPFKQHRLNCNDCHDPHSPAYKPIPPLPSPHTLRMGDQSPDHAAQAPGHERHMPLRRWSLPGEPPSTPPTPPAPATPPTPAADHADTPGPASPLEEHRP